MTAAAIDIQKVTTKLQASGFSRKQASGAAEVLSELMEERASKEATAESLSLIASKLEVVNLRQQADTAAIRATQAEHSQAIARLESGQAEHSKAIARLESGQAELRADVNDLKSGQAILMENQLQLRSEMNSVHTKLDTILVHLISLKPGK